MATLDEHFSGTARISKDILRFGPLFVRRVQEIPDDKVGRNGDLVLVDDTASESEVAAVNRVPGVARLYQKFPLSISPGTFTITTISGVFTITITSLDDFVDAVNRESIPGVSIENTPRGNATITTISSTWADGTSNLPSTLGIAGAQAGRVVVSFGVWDTFITGQLDGVASLVNGQTIIAYIDPSRGKTLSSESSILNFSTSVMNNLDWLEVGNTTSALAGFVMPLDGTVVYASYHNSDDNGNTQNIDLYKNGSLITTLFTTPGTGLENSDENVILSEDFVQGDKIQLRAGTGGAIENTNVSVWVRWRA